MLSRVKRLLSRVSAPQPDPLPPADDVSRWAPLMPEKLRDAIRPFLHPEFFFVNIGANDGVTNDPIYPFVRAYGWRGLLVEPVEHNFAALQRNYADLPGIRFERAAICEVPRRFHYLPADGRCGQKWVKQVGSLKREYLLKTIEGMRTYEFQGPVPSDLEADVVEADVPCLRFEALLHKHAVERFDFLNVDAEGCDYEILASVDLERYRPRVLCAETSEMTPDERSAFEQRIARLGYEFLETYEIFSSIYLRRP